MAKETRGPVIGHDLVRPGAGYKKAVHVVHRRTCSIVGAARRPNAYVGWVWAEGRPVDEWMTLDWFKACQRCRPDLPTRACESDQGSDG